MNSQEFNALVDKIEPFAEQNPKQYKFRVRMFAYLGYLYIAVIMGLLFYGSAYLIILAALYPKAVTIKLALKFGIGMLVLFMMALKALWVRIPPPDGVELKPEQAPKLFEVLREYEQKLQAKKIHKVLIDDDFNCGVTQVPVLGLVGFNKSYLILGLPMLQAISAEQLKAILAHELGHLSGNHSQFSCWIYRVRQTYSNLLNELYNNSSWGTFIFEKFFRWYSPHFSAYSFVLARSNEYEADQCAVELTTKRNTADALVNTNIKGEYLNKHFWKKVFEQAKTQPAPVNYVYTHMGKALAKGITPEHAKESLDSALKVKTTTADTHPCLTDRIKAMGIPMQELTISVARPMEETAADYFLGEFSSELAQKFSSEWQRDVGSYWSNLHHDYKKLEKELLFYQQKEAEGVLSDEDYYKYAVTSMDYSGSDSSIPILRKLLENSPSFNKARFTLGSILLMKNDSEGIGHMERLLQDDSQEAKRHMTMVCDDLYGYYYRQGDMDNANKYLAKLEEREEHVWKAEAEAADFKPKDNLVPHDIPEDQLRPLLNAFHDHPKVKEVYVAKKVLKFDSDYPVYLFGIVRDKKFFEMNGGEEDYKLQYSLAAYPSPTASFFMTVSSHRKDMQKALKKVEGSLIYQK